jgi:cold-inducible RNA-binding protein
VSVNRSGEIMGVRLFVGNINFSLGDADLRDAFAEVGGVERAEIVRDRFDGRSRGFGFVEMSTEDAAALALRELNGRELAGRPLRVEAATSQRRPFERNAARA